MIRLHLVLLISPLPPYGFWSNLIPMERFEENPTELVARDLEKNSLRMSETTWK
jgi:hypothetical protein